MELRQALDTHHELCDAFDNLLLAETHEDAEGKRIWLTHRFINGGEKAMHELAGAARSVLDAPRIWWCEEHRQVTAPSSECRPRCIWGDLVDNQQPCRMVEASVVVDDPTTKSVQDGSSLGSDSHSCPTCKGNVILGIHHLSDPYTGEALPPQEEICPDCNPQESSDDR